MNLATPETVARVSAGASGRTFPVVELFGPTVQGEGPDAGRPAYFVRFGGCDYRCTWCDSMHAVDPVEVRLTADRLGPQQILSRLSELDSGPDLVVLSGGNPALLELAPVVDLLHSVSLDVAVETQGSRWKPWLAKVDLLVVSPKGPSSGMDTVAHRQELTKFLWTSREHETPVALKAVIFDEVDLDHARWLAATWPHLPLHLSTGTDVGLTDEETVRRLLDRLRWLSETVSTDARLRHARIGAQLHVLAWGTQKGV